MWHQTNPQLQHLPFPTLGAQTVHRAPIRRQKAEAALFVLPASIHSEVAARALAQQTRKLRIESSMGFREAVKQVRRPRLKSLLLAEGTRRQSTTTTILTSLYHHCLSLQQSKTFEGTEESQPILTCLMLYRSRIHFARRLAG